LLKLDRESEKTKTAIEREYNLFHEVLCSTFVLKLQITKTKFMWLFVWRIGMFGIAFIGWLLYQLTYKKKKWTDVSRDAMTIAFFLFVWGFLAYKIFT
jgi:hypothetical protein